MLRFGTICEIDPAKGLARVDFDDDGVKSFWLPINVAKSGKDKFYHMLDIGDHVSCLMDENSENGVVLGCIYSEANQPASDKGADIASITFSDGSKVVFDRASGALTIETKGDVTVKTNKNVTVQAAQTIIIQAADGVTIKADTVVEGDFQVVGNMSANGSCDIQGGITAQGEIESLTDVKALGVRLVTHIHPTPAGPSSPPTPTP